MFRYGFGMGCHPMTAGMAACALLLACCGPKTLELPEEPVDKAATCGAVTAAAERAAAGVGTPLSLEGIGRVIQYPMLAASAGESFSSETATRVQKRMTELQDSVVESKWQELIPACKAAFPASATGEARLPDDRFEAQLGCDELGDFLRSSIDVQDEYINELATYRDLGNKLEPALAIGLRSRAGPDPAAQREERRKSLATIAKAGQPVAVMRACVERFG